MLSEKSLQIGEERREVKGKGERKRHTQLNAELQKIAGRNESFLNKQCKEVEEKNIMGNTRDLFKKIEEIKGIYHARMGMIKDRHIKYLTEAEEVKKRW